MPLIAFKDIIYKGRPLCDCLIQRDMNLEEVMAIYCDTYEKLKKQVALGQVLYGDLNINTHDLEFDNVLTEIINALIKADININKNIELISKSVNQIISSSRSLKDESVKASATDSSSGYLDSKISSLQPGTIQYSADKVIFVGFVPVGACFFISRSRINDFDETGKGKKDTDLWGYAISDGNNGTENRLKGAYLKYVNKGALATGGNTGGSNSVSITKEHLQSFELPVTGSISTGLATPVPLHIKLNTNKIKDGSGGDTYLLRLGDGLSGSNTLNLPPLNLSHNHTFSLLATHSNPNPKPIALIPEYILEIPIERIKI